MSEGADRIALNEALMLAKQGAREEGKAVVQQFPTQRGWRYAGFSTADAGAGLAYRSTRLIVRKRSVKQTGDG